MGVINHFKAHNQGYLIAFQLGLIYFCVHSHIQAMCCGVLLHIKTRTTLKKRWLCKRICKHVQYLIFMYEHDVVWYARKSQGSASVGISSLVIEACCRGEEPAFMPGGFWSWRAATSHQREVSQRGCVQSGRGRTQSYLHALGSRRHTGPGGMVDCSQWPSGQGERKNKMFPKLQYVCCFSAERKLVILPA